jgi:DNA-binding transcriptional MerR regulator
MSGVTARTLRYYDEIGLLRPRRIASSGYRIYGQEEVDTLQQILFYRELGFALDDIKKLLQARDFDREQAFLRHLAQLYKQRERLDRLIDNVRKSVAVMKGETTMTDHEKFEGFKRTLIDKNEKEYGEEVRKIYGDAAIDEHNAHLMNLTKEQYDVSEQLKLRFEETLKAAFSVGDPAGELAQQACGLHRQWLCVYYPKYSKAYHRGLGEMYVADERFRSGYDKFGPGCTEFLRDAINVYCRD